MEQPVLGVSDCVIYSVTLYLTTQNPNGSEIYREIVETFDENVITEQKVKKWRKLFLKGWRHMHDLPYSGWTTSKNWTWQIIKKE